MLLNLYGHTGSKNHGCEAIVRSTIKINENYKFKLFSGDPDSDIFYNVNSSCSVENQGSILIPKTLKHFSLKLMSIFQGSKKCYYDYTFNRMIESVKENEFYVSIGGDMYCYGRSWEQMAYLNKVINDKNANSILWGCSIEPDLLKNRSVVEDLKRYALITPRESITYNTLVNAGIDSNTKLYPDPAFTLEAKHLPLPSGFIENNTIGINISSLVTNYEANAGLTIANYIALLQHIIDTSDMQIALIPHVIVQNNDDRKLSRELYNKFVSTGRVVLIDDHNCMELKGYIARCRMFIGTRTHATIAAYSSCVPTLVVGYSVKAKGIARDIFGTYDNYVIPVQALSSKEDLIKTFDWMSSNEKNIKTHLENFMPAYIKQAWQAGKEMDKLLER